MSFFVAEFVLVIQFMWKYIDDILGKGFPLSVLMELIFYFAITIIPMAIPLTVLISSIMVFGNLSERYELSSIKSAGVSLLRTMAPAILIAILTGLFSFLSSNYLKPRANFKFYNLFYTMRKQKPSLTIEEGIFNKDFSNFVIRVGKKSKNGQDIADIIIYDHTERDKDMVNIITAKKGKMYSTTGNGFVMELYDGYQYKDMKASTRKIRDEKAPLMRTKFETFTKIFDLSEFEVEEASWGTSRNKYDMLSQAQLNAAIDSLQNQIREKKSETFYNYNDLFLEEKSKRDTIPEDIPEDIKTEKQDKSISQLRRSISNSSTPALRSKKKGELAIKKAKSSGVVPNGAKRFEAILEMDSLNENTASFYNLIPVQEREDLLEKVIRESNGFKNRYVNARSSIIGMTRNLNVNLLRKHQHFSWAVICIVFVFIGAPLGSIIRKGGYGYPLLVAIIFYVSFIISIIMGEKLIKKGEFSPIIAAWMPVILLTPFALTASYLALRDVKIDLFGYLRSLFSKEE
jgi:lipopolysaccharide export system permease protein